MDLLELDINSELDSVLLKRVGRKTGLNISVILNKDTESFNLFLTLRTKSSCYSLVFDNPEEVGGIISSLKNAKKAMETPLKLN